MTAGFHTRAVFLFASIFLAGATCAASAAVPRAGGATVDELLLFWDEKDLFVESATRSPLPLSRVAENITVIGAHEVEDLHVHSVAEVLNRVTGVFVDFQGQDFLSPAGVKIQGADVRHALVLLDGVPWNDLGENRAETMSIPLFIVDRIEVVKGPGSSAWGSSLGGVVNIITKSPTPSFGGSAAASYGERGSQDYGAEVSGTLGALGYYLHAGHTETSGLRFDRSEDRNSVYGKIRVSPARDLLLTLTAGQSDSDLTVLQFSDFGMTQKGALRPIFGTASLDAGVAEGVRVSLSAYARRSRYAARIEDADSGETFLERTGKDRTWGGTGKVAWTTGSQTLVAGADFFEGIWTQDAAELPSDPEVKKRALFVNDTITAGSFTFTPGYRYDRNNISGPFHSPSVGATYRLTDHTILRAFVARGFSYPPLGMTSSGDGALLVANPDLKPEKVWSYQVGGETEVAGRLWLKATVFYHRQTDAIERVWDALGPMRDQMKNVGKIDTRGMELDAETAPVWNFSLKAGAAYVRLDPVPDAVTAGKFSYTVALKYDDRDAWQGQVSGVYKRWLVEPQSTARSNGAIWDAVVQRKLFSEGPRAVYALLAGHNLLNASQYADELFANPRRWVEASVRLTF